VTFISVDLTPVRQRIEAARESVEQARQTETAAREALVLAQEATAAAVREMELATELQKVILSYAVQPPAPQKEPVADHPAASAATGEERGPLTSMGTRAAVLATLTAEPSRIFEMDELVKVMKSGGYRGTHNAVHVQLSRMAAQPDSRVERVKTGFYRARIPNENANSSGPGLVHAHSPDS
jgi:hypothetical protein